MESIIWSAPVAHSRHGTFALLIQYVLCTRGLGSDRRDGEVVPANVGIEDQPKAFNRC